MSLFLKFNLRSLCVRWRSTLAAVLLVALVVAVFVMVMALVAGLRATYLGTGDGRNLLVLRRGALGESSSQITVEDVRQIRSRAGIARGANDEPLASAEVIVLITLERKSSGKAHVQVRGLSPDGFELRPHIRLTEGRWFRPGQHECVVSREVAGRFRDCRPGGHFRSGRHTWEVVGVFDANQTAFQSEIWMDADEARKAFNRAFYCSVTLRPEDSEKASDLVRAIEQDKRLQLRVRSEAEYYHEQTKISGPLRTFGTGLALVMSVGAILAVMNTMYAVVYSGARDIGVLRLLGFGPAHIYGAYLLQSAVLALAAGVFGCALSLPLNGLATGTFNWMTFAEVIFEFQVTPRLLGAGMLFALVMGVLGGLLPARLAARRPVLDALRGV